MPKIPVDRLSLWSKWRLEIALSVAAFIGLLSFAQQLLLASDPSWIKLIASTAAIAGAPAAVALVSAKLGAP